MIQGDDQLARDRLSKGQPGFVWRSLVADTETPVSAALKLFEDGRGDYLLESVEGGAVRGRYSLMGLAPDLVFRAKGHEAEVNRHWLTDQTAFEPLSDDALAEMKTLVQACRGDLPPELPRVVACLVGYFAYETIGLVEKLPRPAPNPLDLPDMLFVRPTLVLVFDRLADRLFLVAPLWPEGADPAQGLHRGGRHLPGGAGAAFHHAPFPLPPFALYRALRRVNPSPFLYFLDCRALR
jgi:anthranilate synthase component 1